VQRYPVFALVDAGAAKMIGMVVGDNQGIHLSDVPAQGGQPLFGLDAADAGVKKQPYPFGLHIDAVSITARLQRNSYQLDLPHLNKLMTSHFRY
jgi:hypothetical protein